MKSISNVGAFRPQWAFRRHGDLKITVISTDIFGYLPDGTSVTRYDLVSSSLSVSLIDYGIRLQSVIANLGDETRRECVLGFDNIDDYLNDTAYVGAVVGRFANRIRDARFVIDGKAFSLDCNEGDNHLHGGHTGFHNRVWNAEIDSDAITFNLTSPDGESGYPGTLEVRVTVTLNDSRLSYRYEARTDRTTFINITNHAFFNLAGGGNVKDHILQLGASQVLESDATLLPTGRLLSVKDTVFDFTTPRRVGSDFDTAEISGTGGYDLCYVLDHMDHTGPAATLTSPDQLISMVVRTDEPGMQFYTGNFLKDKHAGLCLETQHYPDSPNMRQFPSTLLRANEKFCSTTSFEFFIPPENS